MELNDPALQRQHQVLLVNLGTFKGQLREGNIVSVVNKELDDPALQRQHQVLLVNLGTVKGQLRD